MDFYKEKSSNSQVKIKLITGFFSAYAKIIRQKSSFCYFDFFTGPGVYDNGSISTPLIVMDILKSLETKDISKIIFNDKNKENYECLVHAVENHDYYPLIKDKIKIYNYDASKFTTTSWEKVNKPIFSFVDPFGYKGVSAEFIFKLTEPWGSDSILFFNYNRLYSGLTNPKVQKYMKDFFGDYLDDLKNEIISLNQVEKEKILIKYFSKNINKMGARYLLPIKFFHEDKRKTSHFIVIVSKEILPLRIFKSISDNLCNTTPDYFLSFDVNKKNQEEIDFNKWKISYAENDILEFLNRNSNRQFQFNESKLGENFIDSFETDYAKKNHNIMSSYHEKIIKAALINLECNDKILCSKHYSKRRSNTFGSSFTFILKK